MNHRAMALLGCQLMRPSMEGRFDPADACDDIMAHAGILASYTVRLMDGPPPSAEIQFKAGQNYLGISDGQAEALAYLQWRMTDAASRFVADIIDVEARWPQEPMPARAAGAAVIMLATGLLEFRGKAVALASEGAIQPGDVPAER